MKISPFPFARVRWSSASGSAPMGGGVMRAAAKAAAVGGYRAAHAPWVDQAPAAARRPWWPPPAVLSVTGQAAEGAPPLSAVSSTQGAPVDAGAARERSMSWSADDWELAGGEEEELLEAPRPAPARLVFGPVPTLEEAKAATSDLKDALETLCFSPTPTGIEGSTVAGRTSSSESSCLESLDTKRRCADILPSAPRHAVQAFTLLQGCPAVQGVVASLASDKNVWDAVMKNEKVLEFYNTHQINAPPAETDEYQDGYVNEDEKCADGSVSKEVPEKSENGFMGFMHTLRVKVTEMVNSLSDLFKDLMGASEDKSTTTGKGSSFNMGVGSAFFALAIGAILVILVKRRA